MKQLPLLPLTDPHLGQSQQMPPILFLNFSPICFLLLYIAQSCLSLGPLCPKIATCSSQKCTCFCTVAPSLFLSLYSQFLFVPFCQCLGLTTSDLSFAGQLGGVEQKRFLPSLSLLPVPWRHKPPVPVATS